MQLRLVLILPFILLSLPCRAGSQTDLARTNGVAFSMPSCNVLTEKYWFNVATKDWECQADQTGGGGGIAAGSILLIVSGTCPAGFSEEASLDGKTLFGTLAAHGDVGGAGGSDSMTPAGTNSTVAFTPQGTVSQPTFSGNAVNSTLVSAGTPAGTVSTIAATGDAGVKIGTSGVSGAALTHTHPAPTFTGSGMATHQHSTTATGTVSQPTFTGTPGTVPAETFTGAAFDNRSAYKKVIFCKKD